jgi:secreted trypsin-like serine protease
MRVLLLGGTITALLSACAVSDPNDENVAGAEASIIRGTTETGRPQVVMLYSTLVDGRISRCSGVYFAPRVVLTAAHCIRNDTMAGMSFVYFGSNLTADLPLRYNLPEPGVPTVWARIEGTEVHPSWSKQSHDADLAVVYLDRKLPFDPLPLARFRIDQSWVGKKATLVGWGASKALSADIQTNEGIGVKRTGQAPILGTPTLADYHPEDPNPAMLDATAREHYLKLDGHAPYANGCAGDSGGPIILNQWGQDYIAGIASFTGLWCEDYSLYTRLDPYLPFLDEAYRRGGQAPLVPYVDCVDPRSNGKYVAYFGYKNDNGVSISVPYDSQKNALALDVAGERPTRYAPGDHPLAFGIDFAADQTVTWKLSPTNSPTTEVRATASTKRCPESNELLCLRNCEATVLSPCAADFLVDMDYCMFDCRSTYDWMAGCETEWSQNLRCVGNTTPEPENWRCDLDLDYMPRPYACDDTLLAAFQCLSSGL